MTMKNPYENALLPEAAALPACFVKRRLHSITGFFLVLFLFEHLLVNSQAALFFGDNGTGFVLAVNSIKALPYLPIIELTLLGVPILLHGYWGIIYLFSAQPNSMHSDGRRADLAAYSRNHAYTWQRITSLVLVVGLILHVGTMRFLHRPLEAQVGEKTDYMVKLQMDQGLYTLSSRIGLSLYDQEAIVAQEKELEKKIKSFSTEIEKMQIRKREAGLSIEEEKRLQGEQGLKEQEQWLATLKERTVTGNEIIAVTESFGTAELVMVREAFKSVWICVIYTLFVLAASFHAMNGLWTFAISWGITLSEKSRRYMRTFSDGLMLLVLFFGLAAIWGTYWFNLKS